MPRAPLPDRRCYRLVREVSCTSSEGVTPSFIARTDSCVQPNPSGRFRFPYYGRSLPVVVRPGGERVVPDVISAILVQGSGPLPRRVLPVRLSISSRKPSASRYGLVVRRAKSLCNATSTEPTVSRLQTFANVQTPVLARPTGCTHRRTLGYSAAGPYTPRRTWVVTFPSSGITS